MNFGSLLSWVGLAVQCFDSECFLVGYVVVDAEHSRIAVGSVFVLRRRPLNVEADDPPVVSPRYGGLLLAYDIDVYRNKPLLLTCSLVTE